MEKFVLNQNTFRGIFPSVDFAKIVYSFLFDRAKTFHFEKSRTFSFTASCKVFYCKASQNWHAGGHYKPETDCLFNDEW